MKRRKIDGFTLVELMLVVIIIGSLVAMVLPRFTGRSEQARKQVAAADINSNISVALKLYEMDNGSFPSSSEGLEALLKKPASGAASWSGPYLEKSPVDPWGQAYKYVYPGTHKDYDLYSLGKDGVASADDITNWEE
ncbi:MAG: type II secretion system major pseudopilin GspG [Candidatus Omnitrophica bacterium]|nr:type II secretion system major pseudopilin GspG [Candidatus Omnitrophota bacterium]